MSVVVQRVLAKYGRGVALVDDQDAVEEFAADAADEAFSGLVGDEKDENRQVGEDARERAWRRCS